MKSVLGVTILLLGLASGVAQSPGNPTPQRSQTGPAANLNAILAQVQQAIQATNTDIGRLRIDKWKTDVDQKQQLPQLAHSSQPHPPNPLPALLTHVQA